MFTLNFNNFYLKLLKTMKFKEKSSIYRLQLICDKCACKNFATFSEKLSEKSKSNTSRHEDICNTFGNLQKSLEKSFKKNSSNQRIIRIKKRPPNKKANDADIFGNLSNKNPVWYPDLLEKPKVDNDQSDDSIMIKNISRQYRDPEVYLERMKTFVKDKKLKNALDLFVEMRRNFVTPIHAHFTVMISACGKAGYTEMAFKLFRQMTDRGMQPTPATLTGLFNSCGESPFPDYGLRKARLLKEKISSKNWELTQLTYHAMIKAFGKCGDIQTAFQIVDEMIVADIKIDVHTYSFLLMSCISNKDSGFTHAVEVWRKMKERKCIPNTFSCNLLLRAARDCDIGPEEISSLLLQHWSNFLKRPYGFKRKEMKETKPILRIQSSENSEKVESTFSFSNESTDMKCFESEQDEKISSDLIGFKNTEKHLTVPIVLPSILGERPKNKSDILDLGNIKTASDRLSLVGGAQGFLKEMKDNCITPDIKTFSLLLECLPPYFEEEENLISLLEINNVSPTIGFCNILMKKRILRHENVAAKDVLLLVNKWGLSPDVITFGILAMGCRHYNQALDFLNDLKKLGYCPNIEITGALIRNACYCFDFKYLEHLLKLMEENSIQPNEKILIKIEKTLQIAKKNIIDMQHNKEVHGVFKREHFPQLFTEFGTFYEIWLQKMKFEKEEHVWSQYKTEIVDKHCDESYNIVPSSH